MTKTIFLAGALLAATPTLAREPAVPAGLQVDRVVMLMRHGVRPPTKAPPMPAGTAIERWPDWPVAPGYLTPHGAAAIRRVGGYDRTAWTALGLLARSGCPKVRIVADSDQRTIETARHYAAALVPGCTITTEHRPQDVADPIFSPIDERATTFDAEAARKAVLAAAGPGGIAAEERRLAPLIERLDTILCQRAKPDCGVAASGPSDLAPARPGKRPKLTGTLDRASTAAQILLLEYAEDKSMPQVGWGRATAGDIASLSEFHAVEFRLLARPSYVARANLALIAPLIADAITKPDGAVITMLSGHDTNVASLGGLLDLHWQVPGLAADDPSPGGAIVFERLTDRSGKHYVRALYRSQTVDQIRDLTALTGKASPYVAVLPIAGCSARGINGLCSAAQFATALAVQR
ncbi:histidine-type phosphatase [Sphingomonas sp. XXL09]|uniref:histidine-type phosphatase n=1 Tax=Sphingomonas sp. XXL09 TaxID=3457787 RepID=UPI00406BA9C7